MKVSIVTISYNQAKFLEEAILSVLEQDYNDVEYIVVDPGSTDGSREIIERYRSRISAVIFDPDNGPADGLNKGFDVATGGVYGFLNADDVLERGALSDVVRFYELFPSVDVVSGNSWIIDVNGVKKRRFYSDHFSIWMAVRQFSLLSQASTFFKSEIYTRVCGFNIKNRIAWDGELFLDMALSGAKFSCVNKFWSKFRVHEEGITGSGKLHQLYEEYRQYIFRRIVGRDIRMSDKMLMVFARIIRKFKNPRDTIERLLHGPIYKSLKK
jgi:glycosyltransferase involved in cell wall biosynthesis